MSHRFDCPDRWTAEHEGERAQEWGRGRYANPYDDPFHSGRGCEEAARFWDDGYRRAERREEERQEEEAYQRRAAARREEARLEDEYWDQQQCAGEEFPQEEFPQE